jgi:hypothetical protein
MLEKRLKQGQIGAIKEHPYNIAYVDRLNIGLLYIQKIREYSRIVIKIIELVIVAINEAIY